MNNSDSQKSELDKFLLRLSSTTDFGGDGPKGIDDRSLLGDTPLHFAATSGDIHIGQLLLSAGANPNIRGELGNTPLHEAVGQKNHNFVKLLLAHGALTTMENDDGITPMDLAEMKEDLEMKQLLSSL